jgi:hypothetical protein
LNTKESPMRSLIHPSNPLLGLGMASLVLGFIGLSLFLLPIIGIPVSLFGLCFGVVGFVLALLSPTVSLRGSIGGIGLSGLALAVNLAIAYAPGGYSPRPDVPQPWQAVPDRPFVAPPA